MVRTQWWIRSEKGILTSTSIIISHGPLNREQTEQERDSGGPSTGAVYNAITPKYVARGMHFTARSGCKKDDDDDCRKASGGTNGCNYGELTAGSPQVDKNKPSGQFGEILGRQTVLEVTVSVKTVNSWSSTDEETVEDHKAGKQANCLASGDDKVTILLCKKQESEIELRFERSDESQKLTLAIETAAQIMFANPNSVEETPPT